MDELSNSIYLGYLRSIEELPFDDRFHFAVRLYLWNQDPRAKELLDETEAEFTKNGDTLPLLQGIVEKNKSILTYGSRSTASLRAPYLRKFPQLKVITLVLFRIMYLYQIYGIDCRAELFELFPKAELDKLEHDLLNDPINIAFLSTHAVNFIYLYEKVIKEQTVVDTAPFLAAAQVYDRSDNLHVQLLIYLYTHCIIAETQFYYQAVPTGSRASYEGMITELEALIASHFDLISLDNKFEFLVCSSILGYTTSLQTRIEQEAQRSLSEAGTFLVDKLNTHKKTGSKDLAKSEHRNVLFIMAHRPFTPLAS